MTNLNDLRTWLFYADPSFIWEFDFIGDDTECNIKSIRCALTYLKTESALSINNSSRTFYTQIYPSPILGASGWTIISH